MDLPSGACHLFWPTTFVFIVLLTLFSKPSSEYSVTVIVSQESVCKKVKNLDEKSTKSKVKGAKKA